LLIGCVHVLATQDIIFELPHNRHPNFIGRSAIMSDLRRRLESDRCVALSGIGGVG
jgi:hypothetical protein